MKSFCPSSFHGLFPLLPLLFFACQAGESPQTGTQAKPAEAAKHTSTKASPRPLPSRPNIVFIFADDHAAHAISAYGSRINKTPNIDRIAKMGVRFDNCFVTNSLCAPSRAVVLTGKHSHLNGLRTNRDRFDGNQQTFPKLLRAKGYQTVMLGKWHLKTKPTGFDHWMILKGQGTYYNPRFLTKEGKVRLHGYTTDIITDLAIDWLSNKRDKSRPFCLMVQHKAPHRNWRPGPAHIRDYDGGDLPEPEDLFDDWSGLGPAAKTQTMTVAKHLTPHDLKLVPQRGLDKKQRKVWDAAYGPKNAAYKKLRAEGKLQGKELVRWKYQRYIKDYLRCIASVDDGVGRLLDTLREKGLLQNTVVVYSSDQGFFLGDHGWFDKRWFYEESARMPLLVSWPAAFPHGKTVDALVQNLDFAPTFLELAGCKIPKDMQGKSLLPLLQNAGSPTPPTWRTSIYYHYYEFPGSHSVRKHEGVRTQRYKLVYYYTLPFYELFDLERDPGEHHNVFEDPAYRAQREKLLSELKRLRRQYQVPK